MSTWAGLVKRLAIVLLLCLQQSAWCAAPDALATGLIVKLKESGPIISASLQANPSRWSLQSKTRQHLRLLSVAWRHGLSVRSLEPTAYGAYVLNSVQVMSQHQAIAVAKKLKRDAEVEWAIPNVVERPASIQLPADPLFDQQIWLSARTTGIKALPDFPRAWSALQGRTLSKVIVAVLDSGVPLGHPDLVGSILPGYDFVSDVENARDGSGLDADASDPGNWLSDSDISANPTYYAGCRARPSSWHGLAIAGMLAANTNNDVGGAGMLWQLPGPRLLPVRVAGACGAEVNDIVEGMLWAAGVAYQGSPALNPNPARVINLSFGGDGGCGSELTEGSPGWLYAQTIQALKARGVLVVASAGNGDAAGMGMAGPTRPANCPGVLAVTGLHAKGFKARYSNLLTTNVAGVATFSGEDAGGTAETDHVITTKHSGETDLASGTYGYSGVSGTSFAAPMVTGVAAMMLAVNPNLSVDQLILGIQGSAHPHIAMSDGTPDELPSLPNCDPSSIETRAQCYCTTATCGAGILNAEGALNFAVTTEGNLGPVSSDPVTFFVPERARAPVVTPTPSGGGGGALDPATLAFISMLLGLTLLAGGKR